MKKQFWAHISVFVILHILYLYYLTEQLSRIDFSSNAKQAKLPKIKYTKPLGNFEPRVEKQEVNEGEQAIVRGKEEDINPTSDEKETPDFSYIFYRINMILSDDLPLDRNIPDVRLQECRYWNYSKHLPKASVIVVFQNAGYSVLMRTIHSIIDRTPPQFLEEILLFDDYSLRDAREYLETFTDMFDCKFRFFRNKNPEGLVRSRIQAAKEATGDVIVFLDAYCEVNTNWLPPLLAPISRSRSVMTVPQMDFINPKTFSYRPLRRINDHYRGIFDWGLVYRETMLPTQEKSRRTNISEPYHTPTHSGGVFAVDREFFLALGAYDSGLLDGGGENLELSFKIWQCGGSIKRVPCSRIGHIYKGIAPYMLGKQADSERGPPKLINLKRIAEVWLDNHKEYFYIREPLARYVDHGDISEQLALKQKLNCRSFGWYLTNVAYDVLDTFPVPPPNSFWGELQNMVSQTCMAGKKQGSQGVIIMAPCGRNAASRVVRLNSRGRLEIGDKCIDYVNNTLKILPCDLGKVDGPWLYDVGEYILQHTILKKCVVLKPRNNRVLLMPCESVNDSFKWMFKTVRPEW